MRVIRNLIFTFSITAFFIFVFYTPAYAQVTDSEISAGLESCFEYYDYGEVDVNLTTEKSSYKVGETANIVGTIINNNSFPLVDAVVYAQLRRTNNSVNFITEGHHLLERKQITDPISLLPGETRFITSKLPILDKYPNGSYQVQYYITSKRGYHYSGRPFLEEDFGGSSSFKLTGSTSPLVYFDPASIRVNQQPFPLRSATQEFSDNTLNFSAQVVDTRPVKGDIPVTIKFYDFEDTFEDFLISTEIKTIPSNSGVINVQFSPPKTGAYVMVLRIDSPTVSELKYRFSRTGGISPDLRINDIGITNYPPVSSDKAYICIHSPSSSNTALTSLTLQILDRSKKVIGEKTVNREFSGSVQAISLPFTINVGDDFWVKGIVKRQNSTTRETEVHYTCKAFESSIKNQTIKFDTRTASLLIEARNACGGSLRDGYLESLVIKNDKGTIVKELYNSGIIGKDISLGDLTEGEYIAEIKNGTFSKTHTFMVGGIAARTVSWVQFAVLFLIPVLLLGAVYYYYRFRKRNKDQNLNQTQ